MRRARALRDVSGQPLREQHVGLERDADDLLVVGRRNLQPRQLGLRRGGCARPPAVHSVDLRDACASALPASATQAAATAAGKAQRDIRIMRQLAAGRRLPSIWPMASTTASKVSSVEAWRAL